MVQPPTNWGEDARLVSMLRKKVAIENLIDILGQQSIDRFSPLLNGHGPEK